jgi:transglutaminase-like putative cysteine protease
MKNTLRIFAFIASLSTVGLAADSAATSPKSPPALATALEAAGPNRAELEKALTDVPAAQKAAMQFLIENMPEVDLKSLTSTYLIDNVKQAQDAFDKAPWAKDVPLDIYLNDVVPYASLNEKRDDWRAKLREISAPLVADCKTPGEAGHTLNKKLFPLVKVKYSTARKRPDQSALESMESGIATCSGLSILLVDACRSVGVPARVAGTPMWTNMRGNHTWVEIWDGGKWHFAGAAEPDGSGLDHGWFAGDASKAQEDIPMHSIYASSFKKTGLSFPLVWNPRLDWVPAVNVTARYVPAAKKAEPIEKIRLMVRVLDKPNGKRVVAKVTVTSAKDPDIKFEGNSKEETADLNNILPFDVAKNWDYKVKVELGDKKVEKEIKTTDGKEQIVTVTLAE